MYDLKKQLAWSKLKVGLVITLALLTLFFVVFFAGSIENIFAPRGVLKAEIQDVKGLRRGSPVWLSGIEVGSVKNIQLHPSSGAIVTLSIRKNALEFVRKDAQASVLTMGLLGDKYVELNAGSSAAAPVRSGDMIRGAAQIELKDVVGTSAQSMERLTEFIKKLDNLVTKIEKGEGTIAQLISDRALYDNLREASKTLALTAKEIREARGTMGLLIEDPTLYNKMLSATASVEEFGKKLNTGSGTLMKLVEDPALYNRMLSATASVEEFGKKLNEGSGTLNRLVQDPSLYENLNKASAQLSSILERIDNGEGTAGALIRDEELAKELKETIGEVKELAGDIRKNPGRYFRFSIIGH
ncbi:MAG TPA: MlaD family protein [Thermodesulfovibrionales bacterium]|nr:MlaD family protein [Thermodesulfovibrionales bacterium]